MFSNPSVSKFTFSFVDNTASILSFSIESINPPTSPAMRPFMDSPPEAAPTPRILPFLLITSTLEDKISHKTWQISLKTTLLELLLCNNFPILRVLSNNCTLLMNLPPFSPLHQNNIPATGSEVRSPKTIAYFVHCNTIFS